MSPRLPPSAAEVDWDLDQAFDEDRCRGFIEQVGEEVVKKSTFTLGMEEMYASLHIRYGDEGMADAMSVLHELLDEPSNDGTVDNFFQCWKKSWRERDVSQRPQALLSLLTYLLINPLDPWIPHVGPKWFGPATPLDIRRLRVQNFHNGTAPPPGPPGIEQLGEDYIPKCASQRYKTLDSQLAENVATETGPAESPTITSSQPDAQLPPAQQAPPDLNPEAQKAWEALTAAASASRDTADIIAAACFHLPTDQDVEYTSCEDPSPYDVKEPEPDSSLQYTRLVRNHASLDLTQHPPRIQIVSGGRAVTIPELRSRLITISEVQEPNTDDLVRDRPQQSNRNAALVGGEILNRVESEELSIAQLPGDTTNLGTDQLAPLSKSPSFTQSKVSSVNILSIHKRKWFSLRKLKRKLKLSRKHTNISPIEHNKSAPRKILSGCCILPSSRRQRANSPSLPRHRSSAMYGWLDGNFSPQPSVASSNLNKPLPLSPGDRNRSNYIRRTQSASPTRRSSDNTALNTASTTSTELSNISSKKEFRAITKDLLRQENMENSPTLSPTRRRKRIAGVSVEPRKYNQVPPPPLSFSSIAKGNPFTDAPVITSPTSATPRAVAPKSVEDIPPVPKVPASRPEIASRDISPSELPPPTQYATYPSSRTPSASPPKIGTDFEEPRGRAFSRTQPSRIGSKSPPKDQVNNSQATKRSRSPVKRLLGIGKSTPSKDSSNAQSRDPTPGGSTKRSLKEWGSRIKNGFITMDNAEAYQEAYIEQSAPDNSEEQVLPPQTFPISLDPSYQSRLIADLELMIVISANRFLVRQARTGRITSSSIAQVRRGWEANNRAQVVEYQFDQTTQLGLIITNLATVKFCGEVAMDLVALNAALYAWRSMAREMSIRTFCAGDSVIRKWLNDVPRIFDMLGAPFITFQTFEKIQTKTLLVIGQRQRMASEASIEAKDPNIASLSIRSRQASNFSQNGGHSRNVSNDSYLGGLYGSMEAQLNAIDAVPSQRSVSPAHWPVVTPQARGGLREV